jgi:hypothetical protein
MARPIELFDGFGSFLVIGHLNKTKAFAEAGLAVGYHFGGLDRSVRCEKLFKRFIRYRIRETADV